MSPRFPLGNEISVCIGGHCPQAADTTPSQTRVIVGARSLVRSLHPAAHKAAFVSNAFFHLDVPLLAKSEMLMPGAPEAAAPVGWSGRVSLSPFVCPSRARLDRISTLLRPQAAFFILDLFAKFPLHLSAVASCVNRISAVVSTENSSLPSLGIRKTSPRFIIYIPLPRLRWAPTHPWYYHLPRA